MILLADLDNTLVDRRAAFDEWISVFVEEVGGNNEDAGWLSAEDADGYRPREVLAELVINRFHLDMGRDQLVERLLHEDVELTRPYSGVTSRLEALAAQGTAVIVVTNGTVIQQNAKLVRTGLLALVDDVVISEAVGVKKPAERIFAIALDRAQRIGGAGSTWMVGDHAVADIAGAQDCGPQDRLGQPRNPVDGQLVPDGRRPEPCRSARPDTCHRARRSAMTPPTHRLSPLRHRPLLV